jgi:uncharacterized membrane protein YtjA (UPF0391 family)
MELIAAGGESPRLSMATRTARQSKEGGTGGPVSLATVSLAHDLGPWAIEKEDGGSAMLYYALVFLIVGLIAGVLGLAGVAAIAGQISWILFVIGIVLLVIHLLTGRRLPPVL